MQHFILFMKIPSKRKLQQIASNHSPGIDFKDFMKIHQDYSKKPHSILVNHASLSSDNPLRFIIKTYKVSVSN